MNFEENPSLVEPGVKYFLNQTTFEGFFIFCFRHRWAYDYSYRLVENGLQTLLS